MKVHCSVMHSVVRNATTEKCILQKFLSCLDHSKSRLSQKKDFLQKSHISVLSASMFNLPFPCVSKQCPMINYLQMSYPIFPELLSFTNSGANPTLSQKQNNPFVFTLENHLINEIHSTELYTSNCFQCTHHTGSQIQNILS